MFIKKIRKATIIFFLALLFYSCGDLKSFQDSLNFPDAKIKPNGLFEIKKGVAFYDNNKGADVVIAYVPKNKPQSDSSTSLSIHGSLTVNKKDNVTMGKAIAAEEFYTTVNEANFEAELRESENNMLKSGFGQYTKPLGRAAAAFKNFKIGDPSGPVAVLKTIGDSNSTMITNGICVAITPHAYFFSEQNVTVNDAAISKYAASFEKIYNSVRKNFGQENDVDGNGKITVFIYDMGDSNTLGYFYSADKYSKSLIPYSNEADIFYINSKYAYNKSYTTTVLATLAHEFQHMVYFDTKYNKITGGFGNWADYEGDSWLNEGLSMLSEHYAGYDTNVDNWISKFLAGNYEGLSLTHWSSANYGYSGLFARYLNDKAGADTPKRIYDSGKGGIKAVEILMGKDFNDIFRDFIQTVYLSNQKIDNDPAYNFSSITLSRFSLGYSEIVDGDTRNFTLKPYGIYFIKTDDSLENLALSESFQGYGFLKK